MIMRPVLAEDAGEFHASLDGDGRLWIPAELRAPVGLGEQSVMLRVEDGSIGVYLRKVFDTLGFRPR
jgi:bifunctional DNA-binding transcriptional regulator/antitoxin component of YhaV-PrlF toxin-antitoxin module